MNIKFWLSKLIHEKIFKRLAAQKIGEKIEKEVSEYNDRIKFNCEQCGYVGEKNIIAFEGEIEYYVGEFPYHKTDHAFQCKQCGATRGEKESKLIKDELNNSDILKDCHGEFRYKLIPNSLWRLLFWILVGGFVLMMIFGGYIVIKDIVSFFSGN